MCRLKACKISAQEELALKEAWANETREHEKGDQKGSPQSPKR